MNTASIFIKTDPQVKKEAQKTAKELGLSLSAVVTGLLKEL
jgi:antitoxin component of RelBE/YafQ-DinJ toxin-antitoxin module